MSHQAPGGKSSFSLGWSADADKPQTSVKVRHNPGGASSIVLGTDASDYKNTKFLETAGGAAAQERGEEVDAKLEEEEKKEEEEEAKEVAAAEAAPVAEEPKKASGGILPGLGSDQPHTSVKVRAPPGGKSSIIF